jgi:MFS family permease
MSDVSEATGSTSGSIDALKAVFRSPNLRKLQLAWAGSNLGTWGYGIALAVYAYDQGGAAAVGLVALLRWIPAAIAAPFMGVLGDRHSRKLVMVLSDMGRVVVITIAAFAIFFDASPIVVYLLAAVGVVMATAFRPAQAAITPTLVTTPDELTASNVVASSVESFGMFVGPAIGAVVLSVSGVGEVFLLAAVTFAWSAFMISRVEVDQEEEVREEAEVAAEAESGSFWEHALGGFRTVLVEPEPRLLVGLFSAQTLIAGCLVVLEVVIAIELLGEGDAWVGIIASAFGIGGIIGALAAGALVGRARLATDFGVGNLLWGLPLIAIGIWPHPAVAIVAMVAMGIGNTLVDVSGLTLLQRAVPDDVLARVFGVLETVFLLSVALGAAITPSLISVFGDQTTLVAIGCFLPLVMALTWRRLTALDSKAEVRTREISLLRGISFFGPLPGPVIEGLAGRLRPVRVTGGEHVFAQGDIGDRFYVIAEGEVDIVIDGERANLLGPGGSFGEIALLRDVPRQASAIAIGDCELFELDGDDFVAAVSGHGPSSEAALSAINSYGGSLSLGG